MPNIAKVGGSGGRGQPKTISQDIPSVNSEQSDADDLSSINTVKVFTQFINM